MMDLRMSVVVLLFVFLTGGYSLKCYSCRSGTCETEETCKDGQSKCSFFNHGTKGCAKKCVPGTMQVDEVTTSLSCCDTDLCNAADGVSKGSFLLLFSPLLFYFLFQ